MLGNQEVFEKLSPQLLRPYETYHLSVRMGSEDPQSYKTSPVHWQKHGLIAYKGHYCIKIITLNEYKLYW